MGRYNEKKYHKDLQRQIYERLHNMLLDGIGHSKKEDKDKKEHRERIYSFDTFNSYYKHCRYFAFYIRDNHPECTTLKAARKYTREWLDSRVNFVNAKGERLSAWTIQLEAKAIGKLYYIEPGDSDYYEPPFRNRGDIKRSRGVVERDYHFSSENNDEFIKFCQGTGCRRDIVEHLRGKDLYTIDQIRKDYSELLLKNELSGKERIYFNELKDALEYFGEYEYFIHHRKDKGGRYRLAPIIEPNEKDIVRRMRNAAPEDKVWIDVPGTADIHSFRSDYATSIYKKYARPIEQIIEYERINGKANGKKSDIYVCRKDRKGLKLDRQAMIKASKALGHNRDDIIATHYLRGLEDEEL